MTDTNQQPKSEKAMEMGELNRLIGNGLRFQVTHTKEVRKPGIFGRFRKPIRKTETLAFELKEPTLAVLDRLGAEGLKLDLDESKLSGDDSVKEARTLAAKYAISMARYLAIAVLGEDYTIAVDNGHGGVKYKTDNKRLEEITELFAHTIKPSQLYKMVIAINTIANIADFTNCIRLASSNRTTTPNLIQE